MLDSVDGMEQLVAEVINEPGGAAFGIVITGAQFRWPGGIVPFTIDPALPNVARVDEAIAHWHSRTHIRLVARTTEQNFVTFRPGNGCSSRVGMRGGQQFIDLAPGCGRGSVIHEVGHALGLWHEQSREDRDRFIRILWQNIEPGREHNFVQHITDGDDVGSYDFGSIMHYDAFAFSRNDQPTIETLNGEAIGQRNGLSDGDIQAVNFMYPYTAWNHANLTQATGAPGAGGDPAGYTWDVDSPQHVVYRGTDGHIHELWFNGQWNHGNLTLATGAPGAGGDPAGYTWDVDSPQHVVYRGTDGHIHELWFNGQWNHANLTQATGAPGAGGDPAGYTWDVDRTQHVVYRGTDGHIHELWFNL